ncbi:unnamed protein product, partial [Notodromas monacha]
MRSRLWGFQLLAVRDDEDDNMNCSGRNRIDVRERKLLRFPVSMSGEVQHLLQFLKLVTGLSGYLVLFASRAERLRKVREANGVAVINPLTEGDRGDALINRKLPKELLLRIFSHLDVVTLCRCARVCKYWNVLALDGSNWQKI